MPAGGCPRSSTPTRCCAISAASSTSTPIADFREIDDLVRAQATARVIGAIAHGLPAVQSVPRNSELGLLRHQMELQRPSQSIRDMIGKMPAVF